MTGIGINLNDLGINSDPTYRSPQTQEDAGYPKEYDFALDLHIHGSWQQMRDALYPVAEKAFRGRETPLLGFTLHWARREDGDTEESIKAALTGLKYDEQVHYAFAESLEGWAENQSDPSIIRSAMAAASGGEHLSFIHNLAMNEYTPEDVRREIMKNSEARHTLLFNPTLGPQMVREVYELIKDEPWAAAIVVRASAAVPAEILEALARGDYEDERIADHIVRREDLTEQALRDLIGKCGVYDILSNPACTDRIRAEIDRVSPSGGALTPKRRGIVCKALDEARAVIAGELAENDTYAGAALLEPTLRKYVTLLLPSLKKYPEMSLGLAGQSLERLQTVDQMAKHRLDAWVVAELVGLGLSAQGWSK